MNSAEVLKVLDRVFARAARLSRATDSDVIEGTHVAAAIVRLALDAERGFPGELIDAISPLVGDEDPARSTVVEPDGTEAPGDIVLVARPLRRMTYSPTAQGCIAKVALSETVPADPTVSLLRCLLQSDAQLRQSLTSSGHDPDVLVSRLID